MSGIFGIFNFDGQPVAREQLETMRDGMAYWGPDGSALWQDGPIGLGHLLLHNTPQASGESLPLRDPASGIVLTAHARIDNRGELGIRNDELGIRKGEGSAIPDGALILQAYLRWGEDCVHHLVGDWAFAAWDPRRRTLFIARDPCGISSLYTYRSPHCFAFASCIKGLLALPDVPRRPNLFRVAQVLTSWPGDGVQTAYEEIFQLPPAHTLTVTPEKAEPRQYWFVEEVPPVRLGSDEAYVEAFLEVYAEAVRCRTLTPSPTPRGKGEQGVRVCATLSSGLDSGSVCALAARELRARGERQMAFTSVPLYP
ncbi:MAG: asparagine synthetase B, partial [Anaerolineae bacterium]|nr:asparagine synthetase B [Anaerolineae bacterium]